MMAIENAMFAEDIQLDTSMSFSHYVQFLKNRMAEDGVNKGFYNYIIQQFEAKPHLLMPFKNMDLLQDEKELLQLLVSTIFPLVNEKDKIFALSTPWHFQPFYYSKSFEEVFFRHVKLSDKKTYQKFRKEKIERLYGRILEKFYNIRTAFPEDAVYPIYDEEKGLVRYYKVFFDLRFVQIEHQGELPQLDKCFQEECLHKLMDGEQLMEVLPLHLFTLSGFNIIYVKDVTEEAVVVELKNGLLNMLSHTRINDFKRITKHIQNLLGVPDATVSLVPFAKINNKLHITDAILHQSVIGYTTATTEGSLDRFQDIEAHFLKHPLPIIVPAIDEATLAAYPFLKSLELNNISSYILIPFLKRNTLLGVLEIASTKEHALKPRLLTLLKPIQLLLVQALSAYLEQFNENVEHLIKENFTSLQPAVEWKFKEVIHQYLQNVSENGEAEVGEVTFNNVYPFYGNIDIRNSSLERSHAIQKDLKVQLHLLLSLIDQLQPIVPFLLLDEIRYNIFRINDQIKNSLTSEEEVTVIEFLSQEVNPLLAHLKVASPASASLIDAYMLTTHQNNGYSYIHRKQYENSIHTINAAIDKYLEEEKAKLQKSYPHYFEKYKTDGMEYNIYIGQSIAPALPFHTLYQKNLYLWQLKSMAEISRMTHGLTATLPVALQTTALIYVHSAPLSISFRKDERKFDVADAYNMRYEIIKKRIDKVHIKNTTERLTQPGTIAIVYNNNRDADVFESFIAYLAAEGLLHPDVEHLELEDLQGVSGLKALRVSIPL